MDRPFHGLTRVASKIQDFHKKQATVASNRCNRFWSRVRDRGSSSVSRVGSCGAVKPRSGRMGKNALSARSRRDSSDSIEKVQYNTVQYCTVPYRNTSKVVQSSTALYIVCLTRLLLCAARSTCAPVLTVEREWTNESSSIDRDVVTRISSLLL
jgi:hypothetical protein